MKVGRLAGHGRLMLTGRTCPRFFMSVELTPSGGGVYQFRPSLLFPLASGMLAHAFSSYIIGRKTLQAFKCIIVDVRSKLN